MQGRRLPGIVEAHELLPGEYGKSASGRWLVRPPNNADGRSACGALSTHIVVEHDDGTITVRPSIKQTWGDGEELWHGFLEAGAWRVC